MQLMKLLISGLTLVSFPVATSMPFSVLLFWLANNTFSFGYTSALLFGPTRAALGLPPRDLAPSPGSPAELASTASLAMAASGEEVGRAQLAAATSLASLADSMAEGGELEGAVAMQQRALNLSEESHGDAHEHTLRARWRLAELQERAGLAEEARANLERWREAGGDAAIAEERIARLG